MHFLSMGFITRVNRQHLDLQKGSQHQQGATQHVQMVDAKVYVYTQLAMSRKAGPFHAQVAVVNHSFSLTRFLCHYI